MTRAIPTIILALADEVLGDSASRGVMVKIELKGSFECVDFFNLLDDRIV